MAEERTVCVTGAGGFVASWLVKLLLSKGFTVHGTVRDPGDVKNAHLRRMENSGNLKLFKADILDYESLAAAIAGCEGVFHAACPVPLLKEIDPEVDMIRPAVDGTLNVLKACSEANVKRVVLVSSLDAIMMNPNSPLDKIIDEDTWSDKEFCRNNGIWYPLAKTLAEEEGLKYSKSSGLDVVVICPALVLGPLLQPTINDSSLLLIGFWKGELPPSVVQYASYLVDVRDVANAALLIYEKPEASGRYICCSHVIKTVDFCDKCKSLYPGIQNPECSSEERPYHDVTSAKLKQLGWDHLTLEETIRDTVEDLVAKKLLDLN